MRLEEVGSVSIESNQSNTHVNDWMAKQRNRKSSYSIQPTNLHTKETSNDVKTCQYNYQ